MDGKVIIVVIFTCIIAFILFVFALTLICINKLGKRVPEDDHIDPIQVKPIETIIIEHPDTTFAIAVAKH